MSIMNDYSAKLVAEQHQRDLWAEAAKDRLVALARGDRRMWWRRLMSSVVPATKPPVPSGVVQAAKLPSPSGVTGSSQPVPC